LTDPKPTIRLDKWLWFARFFKTRSLSAKQVKGGHLRVNGDRVVKASHPVFAGDTLTFAQGRDIKVVKILDTGNRRGPAGEAQALYLDKSPPAAKPDTPNTEPEARKGRPTKQDRRAIAKFKGELE